MIEHKKVARAEILAEARSWLGTPFQHQGRLKGRGLDCVGLPLMVAIELGIRGPDGSIHTPQMFGNYPPQPVARAAAVRRKCEELLIPKDLKARLPGDVLAIRLPLEPCHSAILGEMILSGIRVPSLIHAYRGAGKVVEHILDEAWVWRLDSCFEFPGIS